MTDGRKGWKEIRRKVKESKGRARGWSVAVKKEAYEYHVKGSSRVVGLLVS